jgi:hypothetical protein
MISIISPQQALTSIKQSLSVSSSNESQALSNETIAQALRRAVHILAPCAPYELERAVARSFSGFGIAKEELTARVQEMLEELVVYGDILEMRTDANDPWALGNAFALRGAPPSFVARKNGSFTILGVAGDQVSPLTATLEARTVHLGALRILTASDGEDLRSLLKELDLLELPEKVWLRIPRIELASAYVETWRRQIALEPAAGAVDGLRILDTARSPSFYRDRWCEPSAQHDGVFVARRPQKYGAELWCLVELSRGAPQRFVDLVSPGDRIRPCDIAWRIQAALDSVGGTPQQYQCSSAVTSDSIVRFFSPLPSWVERHLSVVGRKTKAPRCLFSYELATSALDNEVRLLREMMWMTERAS